jgi:hypothetical protein
MRPRLYNIAHTDEDAPSRIEARDAYGRRPMGADRLEVSVTYDERRGYVGTAPELRLPVVALSLGGLRRKIEIAMLPDDLDMRLVLDRSARLERDRRRATLRPTRVR